MYFKLINNDKNVVVDNADKLITLSVLFNGDETLDHSYDVMLINQINNASGAVWQPNILFPLFTQFHETGVTSMIVFNDNDLPIMTFPAMNMSYRMTNSNLSNDRLSDTNDRPQERLEFTFKEGVSFTDVTV